MALTQVTGPYPIFTDLDGTPLDDGYLYIGEINQDPEQNPIQVFWDSNLTIPATQPIRTSNGYAYRNGTPALLYTAGEFSITIRNKREEFVLYSPVGYGFDPAAVSASVVKNDFTGDGVEVSFVLSASPSTVLATNVFINGVYQEKDSYTLAGNTITFSIAPPLNSSIEIMTNETGIINSGNATAISYTASFAGATLQTVQTKLEQYVSVMDFGAVGDGVTDDTAAFAAAIAAVKRIYIPEGTYLVDTIDLLDVTGYTLEGASTTGTILKGKATSSIVLNVRGSTPGGLNTYNTFKNFKVDTSLMDAVVPGAAIGINLINTWGNSFYNINVPTVSFPQRALYVQQHVYTTTFENCDFYAGNVPGNAGVIEINGFFPSITYSVTTLTFVGCLFAQCLMNYASGITFLQPIAQGDVNKFQMNNVSGVSIIGGDIEGTQTYLAFGTGCDNVVSLNNVLIGFIGTYKSGTLVSGYLMDQTNDPYYFVNNNGTTTTAEMNGVVDEIATAGFITRKSIKNSNVTSQTVDIDFENANGNSYVGMSDAGDTYIDNRASGSVALQQVGVDRVGVDAAGQLIINTTTAGTAGAVAGYIVFSNGVNTYKIPYHAV